MITVNSRSYDGAIRKSWTAELVGRHESVIQLRGEFENEVDHPDLGLIQRGTISTEFYWLDKWYNVFRFNEPDGRFRNFYCNIAMPAKLEFDVLDYVDLDIDILVQPDLSYSILDQEDFRENAERFGYPSEVKEKVQDTLYYLVKKIESGKFPHLPDLFATPGSI